MPLTSPSIRRRNLHHSVLGVLLAGLCGCSSQPAQPPTPPPMAEVESPAPAAVPARPFEADTFYALLVAEFAAERQRFDVMLNNYAQQAVSTRDPGVVARAARVSRYLGAHEPALDMALLWAQIEPQNLEAHYNAAAELVRANRLEESIPHAQKLLEAGEEAGFDAIGAQALQSGDAATAGLLITRYRELLQQHPDHAPLHLGLSFLAQQVGDLELALSSAQRAQALDRDSFQAAGQETRVLQEMGREEQALARLGDLVEQHPENNRLKLQYARSLLKTDLGAAESQFQQMLDASPEDPDLLLTVALIQFERGRLSESAGNFRQLLPDRERQSAASYYLGRIALRQGNEQQAIDHLRRVGPGDDYLPAMSELTDLLLHRGDHQEALLMLRSQREATPRELAVQREGLTLLEAHVLASSGQTRHALAALHTGIQEQPDSARLLYTRGLLFARLDQVSRAEEDFKRLLDKNPDDAATLNALGYTLADQTQRLDEAYQYISRAYQLAPEDPAVIDSMGWVEYLRGNHQVALSKLRRAMSAMPDPEIAAHLGEVLWVTGEPQEARQVWQEGLRLEPDNPIIHRTIKRLQVNLD